METMQLDRATCRRARLARDARFDGRFFVGVRTTGVFCRPICPAVAPRERNVEYFPTAAAAAEAGFRACLRCRPECAPGTPAWAGVSTTIARALRLIGDEGAEIDGIETLAARLGVGARHLRRLFLVHLGASPVTVLQTRRLLSAKRLIDETDLPLTRVAMASGFGSIRRFNAAFLASYGRNPGALRAASRGRARPRPQDRPVAYAFELGYRPPLDWDALLSFLAPRATQGVEVVGGDGTYTRSIEIAGQSGWLRAGPADGTAVPLEIQFPDSSQLLRIVARVRRLFDLDADPMAIDGHLEQDLLLLPLVRRRPGLRVPGAWDGFELGVRAILGQQVSVKAATGLAGRLVSMFGQAVMGGADGVTHLFPRPGVLATADLRGMPRARCEAVRQFARAAAAGEITFGAGTDPADFREAVQRLPGLGSWTAEYMALRGLGDPDAFPSSDLGLLRATGLATARQLEERSGSWRPWRAYAAMHLWAS